MEQNETCRLDGGANDGIISTTRYFPFVPVFNAPTTVIDQNTIKCMAKMK